MLDQILIKQALAYEDYEFYRRVGDWALAEDAWEMVLYYQQRIATLTQEH